MTGAVQGRGETGEKNAITKTIKYSFYVLGKINLHSCSVHQSLFPVLYTYPMTLQRISDD